MVGGQRRSSRRLPWCGLAFASCGVSFQHADSPVELACKWQARLQKFPELDMRGFGREAVN
jgi:hypothetical protein